MGSGGWGVTANTYKASLGGDGSILELYSDDDCTAL